MTTVLRINRGDVRAEKQSIQNIVRVGFAQLIHFTVLPLVGVVKRSMAYSRFQLYTLSYTQFLNLYITTIYFCIQNNV